MIVSSDFGLSWQAVGPVLPFTPSGVTYSPERKAFYAWQSDCPASGDNSVKPDAIVRLAYIPTSP
jgi:hypothetical protein